MVTSGFYMGQGQGHSHEMWSCHPQA